MIERTSRAQSPPRCDRRSRNHARRFHGGPSRNDLYVGSATSVPTIDGPRYRADAGGVLAYGPDFVDEHRRAASYVDRVLKGERRGELPVQTPTKFEFVSNLKAAMALGINIPVPLLGRGEEIIE